MKKLLNGFVIFALLFQPAILRAEDSKNPQPASSPSQAAAAPAKADAGEDVIDQENDGPADEDTIDQGLDIGDNEEWLDEDEGNVMDEDVLGDEEVASETDENLAAVPAKEIKKEKKVS